MPLIKMICTNCNGYIELDSSGSHGKCTFCGTPYLYEPYEEKMKELYDESKDFQIRSGILERYTGNFSAITIPNRVSFIADNAFENCNGITSVQLPNTLTQIGENAFAGCSNLERINIPDSVKRIGYGAFSRCSSLERVILPKGLIELGDNAFFKCISLCDVSFPDTLSIIGNSTFCFCESLQEAVIPEGVQWIAWGAFSSSGLVNVSLPRSLIRIDDMAFADCFYLRRVSNIRYVSYVSESAFVGSPYRYH